MAEIPKSKVVNCPLTFQIHDSRLSSQNPKSSIGDYKFPNKSTNVDCLFKIPNPLLETVLLKASDCPFNNPLQVVVATA